MRFRDMGLWAVATVGVLTIGGAQAQDVHDWTGFYAGIYGGAALDSQPSYSGSISPFVFIPDDDEEFVLGPGSFSLGRTETLFGGLQAGYNHQFNQFVVGAEGSLSLGRFGKSYSGTIDLSYTEPAGAITGNLNGEANYDANWYLALAGRAGMAFGDWLVYAKGGVVVADYSVSGSINGSVDYDPAAVDFPIAPGDYNANFQSQVLGFGALVGFGLETMITDSVSVGAEYAYVALPGINSGGEAGFGSIGEINGDFHSLKATLNYHF